MNRLFYTIILGLTLLTSTAAASVPLSFTHQGILRENGALVNGEREIVATIYDDNGEIAGQKSETLFVESGLYVLTIDNIDLAKVVTTDKLTLQVSVNGEDLTPALDITAVPYALAAKHATVADTVSCNGCISKEQLDFAVLQDSDLPRCKTGEVLRANGDEWRCSAALTIDDVLPEENFTVVRGALGVNAAVGYKKYAIYSYLADKAIYDEGEIPADRCLCDVDPGINDCPKNYQSYDDNGASCYDEFNGSYAILRRQNLLAPMADMVLIDGGSIGIGTGLPQAPIHLRTLNGAGRYEVIISDYQPEILLEAVNGSNYKVALVDGELQVFKADDTGNFAENPTMAVTADGLTVSGTVAADNFSGHILVSKELLDFNYADSASKGGPATKALDLACSSTSGCVDTADLVAKSVTGEKLADVITASLGRADNSIQKAAGSVLRDYIPDGAINSAKIENGTITNDDIAFNYAASASKGGPATKALDLACSSTSGCVDTADLVAKSVTGEKLADVITASLDKADNSIQKAAGSVLRDYINDNAINSAKIENGTITNDDLASNTITTAKIDRASFLDIIYPVGSVYITMSYSSASQVASVLGGTWTQLSAGYTLWTASSGVSSSESKIAACLPNIKGTVSGDSDKDYQFLGDSLSTDGAFGLTNKGSKSGIESEGYTKWGAQSLTFNAGSSNSLYQDTCTTVQPPAIKVYMYRRTK